MSYIQNGATEKLSPMLRRVRAYFAPVDRVAKQPTLFDATQNGGFALNAPPAPWVDLGWIEGFERRSGTVIEPVKMGSPAATFVQTRTDIEATVSFSFQNWGKLQLALACGTQQMNLLTSAPAVALQSGSTANTLAVGATAAAAFSAGQRVVVDVDYTGQTGFVGSAVSGAYVKSALTDVDYVRRMSLNVGRIAAINEGVLTLESPLLAGVPTTAMKVSGVVGFCDREGSSFFQEWSALFVGEGQQGERVLWLYPRVQAMSGIAETIASASGGYEKAMLRAELRALPVKDAVDGERVVCFRSYVVG